ncbi:hypothetical protein KIF24_17115 [Micromonospora sp. Llam7]|uniref:hypothetical protein n=1 Tax=Micromonospora tarapacensis TaxID=2835305 RepID=UPI001C82AE96|nr:hypothetical protein [Micromonospora tarapacensis]MBX7267584.1 hypothetical protein [Micromonospora tarapacensis]
MSRQELADEVNKWLAANRKNHRTVIDETYVGKLERGEHRWPTEAYRCAFQVVLGAASPADLGFYPGREPADDTLAADQAPQPETSGDPADVLPPVTEIVVRGAVTVPLHTRIMKLIPPVSMDVPRRIGGADVARIEATTSAFRDWDNRWGGGLSRAAVIAQLQWVAATASRSVCSSGTVKNRLLTALADLAGVAAFLSYDVNQHPQARSLWMVGLDAASEASNVDLVGTTLRQLAHQSLHLGRPDEALRLVRLSYATTVDPGHHVSELALAEIAAYEGWSFAAAGRLQPCHRALGRAQEHFANADGEPAPPWLAHLDSAELTALRGHSYHVLAHRVPEVVDDAETLLRQAVAGRDSAYARSRTLNLIALSGTFFQRGDDLEEGVTVGDQALGGAGTLTSPRALDRLRALKALTVPHTAVAEVAQFQHRIDTVLADD